MLSCTEEAKAPTHEPESMGHGDDHHDAPYKMDMGSKAWLQVLGAFFLWFNTWGIINTWGAFQTFYEQDVLSHESTSSIAWIGSIQSCFLLLIGVITGPLFDKGYFYAILPFGTFMVCLGYMMTSLASQYYQVLLAQGLCVGIGIGLLFTPAVALLPQYFDKKRALANGIAATGSSIGGIIYPTVFYNLQRQIGFAWATRVLAFIALGTCGVSIAVMRTRFPPKQSRSLLQLSAFKEVPYTLTCVAILLGFIGHYNFLNYLQPLALRNGLVGERMAFYLLPILNAASTFGRITPNFIADYWGPVTVLLVAASITTLLAFCWIAVQSGAGIITLAVVYGFFSGGYISLPPVIIAVLTEDLRNLGTRLGMFFAFISIGLLIGTPIGGAILQDSGSVTSLQAFSGACLASSSAAILLVKLLH